MRNYKDIHKFYLNDKYIVLDVNSGAVHEVDEIVYSLVDDNDNKNIDLMVDKYKSFEKEDVVSAIEEINFLEREGLLYSQREEYSAPLHSQGIIKALCLHIAHDCNLKCKYCFASQGNFKGARTYMSTEVGKRALDFLVENSGKIRNLEVDFFGGEPLMNFDVVKEITYYGRELEKKTGKVFRFTLTTNAVLLDDEITDFLNEHMSNVVLSLDGRKEVNDKMRLTVNDKGSYDLIAKKIQKFVEKRGDKDYYVRGTFTSENLDFGKDVEHFKDLGFKSVSIEPVVADPREPYAIRDEHLDQVLKEYGDFSREYIKMKKSDPDFSFFHFEIDLDNGPCVIKRASGCGAGSEYLAVTPEGDLFPCHQFVGEDGFSMGNVFDGIKNEKLREKFQAVNVYSKEECKDCWARYYCSGGCHANSYHANNGDFTKVYELGCKMGKKRIESAISILANLRGD
ncbi:MAG: thioether cross-link-forming SCIFF peptide maturase [Tissierellia bacterium]|nr:thioether cross-link-forming SCIFF peptide maturase [Tissierellia bacterium]